MRSITTFLLLISCTFCHAQDWNPLDIGIPATFLQKVYFINDDVGLIGGFNNTILKTTDGGNSWYPTVVEEIGDGFIYEIIFADDQIGYANGFKTTDGGETWLDLPNTSYFRYFYAINENHLIGSSASWSSHFAESFDGGTTWDFHYFDELIDSPWSWRPQKCSFIDENIGYMALGSDILAQHDTLYILKTNNSGTTWNSIPVPAPVPYPELGFYGFNDIHFITENVGLLIHNTGVLKTEDGGQTWDQIWSTDPTVWWPTNIYAASVDHYILTGFFGFSEESEVKLYESFDGGQTWNPSIITDGSLVFESIACAASNCFAVGTDDGPGVVYSNFEISTFLAELSNKIQPTIFPNPVSDYLQVQLEDVVIDKLQVIDALGRTCTQVQVDGSIIDVSQLSNGFYFLKIDTPENSKVSTFVKE